MFIINVSQQYRGMHGQWCMMTDVKDDQISNDLISTDEQHTNGLEDTRLVNIIFLV